MLSPDKVLTRRQRAREIKLETKHVVGREGDAGTAVGDWPDFMNL